MNYLKILQNDNISQRISSFVDSLTDEQKIEHDKKIDEYNKQELIDFFNKRFIFAGIGDEYLRCSFENYYVKNEYQKKLLTIGKTFTNFVKKNEIKNLILTGDSGTGKTHIATAILKELNQTAKKYVYGEPIYFDIRYSTISDISDELHSASSFDSKKNREQVVKEYAKYDVLVIDEIGRLENKFENESDLIFRIIDKRYQYGTSTILISNLNGNKFMDLIGTATYSRLNAFNRVLYFDTKNIKDYRLNQI